MKPCLLHGDLWSGNISAVEGGEWAILDPATYYGACCWSACRLHAVQCCALSARITMPPGLPCCSMESALADESCMCRAGHHEAEFGMQWCAGFSSEFWEGYHELIPRAPGGAFEHRPVQHMHVPDSAYHTSHRMIRLTLMRCRMGGAQGFVPVVSLQQPLCPIWRCALCSQQQQQQDDCVVRQRSQRPHVHLQEVTEAKRFPSYRN